MYLCDGSEADSCWCAERDGLLDAGAAQAVDCGLHVGGMERRCEEVLRRETLESAHTQNNQQSEVSPCCEIKRLSISKTMRRCVIVVTIFWKMSLFLRSHHTTQHNPLSLFPFTKTCACIHKACICASLFMGGERGSGQWGLRRLIAPPPKAHHSNEQTIALLPGLPLAPGEAFPEWPLVCGPPAARRQRLLREVFGLRPVALAWAHPCPLPGGTSVSVCGCVSVCGQCF